MLYELMIDGLNCTRDQPLSCSSETMRKQWLLFGNKNENIKQY